MRDILKRKKILLVDDEETILLGLHRKLYSLNSDCDILLASSGEIAQQILTEQSIEVMVTDVRMPGISGVDLLAWTAVHSPMTRVIIMTAFDVAQLQEQASKQGCLQIVQKPFDLNKMRNMIKGLLDDEGGLGGSIGALSTADVIQMLCLSQRTTALRVVEGSRVGMIHIAKGEIIHATWNGKVGEEAVYHILQASEGVFNTLPLLEFDTCTVSTGWQQLLLEGMRLADEGALDIEASNEETEEKTAASPAENPTPKKQINKLQGGSNLSRKKNSSPTQKEEKKAKFHISGEKDKQSEGVSELLDRGFEHLRRKEYLNAKEVWEKALLIEPGNRILELNIKKLEKMVGHTTG